MALTDAEVESLRFHLGYGNVDVGAYPYTPDGFKELFRDVIGPNITGTVETSATTAITAGASVAVTPVAMTGIVTNARLVVDVGDDVEVVVVKATSVSTFTAKFAKDHPVTGYPVALMGGQARIRILLHQADKQWAALHGDDVGATAGLKQVDKGDVEWFPGGAVFKERTRQYESTVESLSSICRVAVAIGGGRGRGSSHLEAY